MTTVNNSSYGTVSHAYSHMNNDDGGNLYTSIQASHIFDVVDTSNYKVKFAYFASDSNITLISDTNYQVTAMTFIRLGDI